jgi:hypothetical protein
MSTAVVMMDQGDYDKLRTANTVSWVGGGVGAATAAAAAIVSIVGMQSAEPMPRWTKQLKLTCIFLALLGTAAVLLGQGLSIQPMHSAPLAVKEFVGCGSGLQYPNDASSGGK